MSKQSGIKKIVGDIFRHDRTGWSQYDQRVEDETWVNVVRKQFPRWLDAHNKWFYAASLGGIHQLGRMKKDEVCDTEQVVKNDAISRMFSSAFPMGANVVFFFNSFIHPFRVTTQLETLPPMKRLFRAGRLFTPHYTSVRVHSFTSRKRHISTASCLDQNKKKTRKSFTLRLKSLRRGKPADPVVEMEETPPSPAAAEVAAKDEDFFADAGDFLTDEELVIASELFDLDVSCDL